MLILFKYLFKVRGRETDLPAADSLFNWPPRAGLSQVVVRSFIQAAHVGGRNPITRTIFHRFVPGHSDPWSWIRSGAAGTGNGAHVGCQHHRWLYYLLCHNAGHNVDPNFKPCFTEEITDRTKQFYAKEQHDKVCFKLSSIINMWRTEWK